jgi:ATP-dependent RNA helicase DeaD
MATFKGLGLNSEIMRSLDDLGFTEPSPIQEKSIPFLLKSKKDLIALAQTGTGKTAAFSLPILNQIESGNSDLEAIILCPTRELCLQISQDIKKLAKHSRGIITTPVYGGESIVMQIKALKRGTNIVVGTPGRVSDLIRRRALKLHNIKWLVLDEADEMLDMGFKDDLDAILSQTPSSRQTLLFSATMSRSVHTISRNYMTDTEEISVGEKNVGADNVTHEYYVVQGKDRFDALKRILDNLPGVYGILFCRTRNETQLVADKLKKANYDTEAIHGDVSQGMRTKIMDRFKRKQVRLLVATDVAARGIDVSNLTHVINYNLPDQNEAYTHRSGRTGRANNSGVSIAIVTPRDVRTIRQLENMVGKKIEYKKIPSGEEIYQKQIDGFFEEMEKINLEKIEDDENFAKIADKLKKYKKKDLIKLFITYKFSDTIGSHKNIRDLNADPQSLGSKGGGGGNFNLKINVGKKNGLDIKSLFALINSSKNLSGIEIGRIDLMPEHAIFSVEKGLVDEVIKSLEGVNFKGINIKIVKSGGGESYTKNRRSRPRGGSRGSYSGYKGKSSGGYKGKSGGSRGGFKGRKTAYRKNK